LRRHWSPWSRRSDDTGSASWIDEYWLKVDPVAIGRGGAVFGALEKQTSRTLVSARSFASGNVAVYRS
jgi:hypothetical protein